VTKQQVRDFWDQASCGEVYAKGASVQERLDAQAHMRYRLEPYIAPFARFDEGAGRDVLEVGVGMGADHLEWAKSRPARLAGIDYSARAVDFTRARLAVHGLTPSLSVADAEKLPFADGSFDLVYSWGVLHHSPDTGKAVAEVGRVLRAGGTARVMIYHTYSLVGYLLWVRYALLAGRPDRSLASVYAHHLESPGTQAFTAEQARKLFTGFSRVQLGWQLSCGDLLEGAAGQRHGGALLAAARKLWPRWLIRRLFRRQGLFLLIEAVK
jgi:ubiquinone/menaquinone biosynthesis C-methylase UbiE